MKLFIIFVSLLGAAAATSAAADKPTVPSLNLTTAEAGNPLFDGWFADPEIRAYDDVFWIFATTSVAFKNQKHFDAWSSTDLVHWYVYPCAGPISCCIFENGNLETIRMSSSIEVANGSMIGQSIPRY